MAESASTPRRGSALRNLFDASRPVSWINTAYPFAAAYFLSTGRIDALLVLGTIFFLIPYNLAMYGINDVFDYESDLANPRKGGLEGAVLDRSFHKVILTSAVVMVVPFVVVMVELGPPVSWLVLALSLFAVVAYSAPGLRFKERPVLDSVTSSFHFVSPALYGLVAAGTHFTGPLVLLLVAFFFWGTAAHAFGAVQDVVPDRSAGISSIATVFSARGTVRIAVVLWALAGVCMLFTPWPGPLAAVLVLPYIVASGRYWNVSDQDSERAHGGWSAFIWINYAVGFLVTLLLIWWYFLRVA